MRFKLLSILVISIAELFSLQSKAANRCSLTSHYGIGDGYHGKITANGEKYNAYKNSAAHRFLPFGTKLKVTNQVNGKSVIVRVNDRGPYVKDRDLDLSYNAFFSISSPNQGVAKVCYNLV